MTSKTTLAATLLLSCATAGAVHANGGSTVVLTNPIDTSITLDPTCVYSLDGQVYVTDGACLTIPAGTVFANAPDPLTGEGGSLAVTKGSQIKVCGEKENPVIFTSEADRATWTGGDPSTGVWREAANEWGNITIMGCGYVSEDVTKFAGNVATCDAGNQAQMEGLTAAFPGDPNVLYGGGDDDDDSGKLEYLSIRFGGRVIGLANELNGLSLGGIGRGTDIDYVEIMNNVDDGIEIWGGTVNLKHVSVWNVGDDSIDIDQGWRGKMQFALIVQGYSLDNSQGSGVGDNCFEQDGAENSDQQPVTTAVIYNSTVIGQPLSGDGATAWRDNARIQHRQSIFMDIGDELVRFDNTDDCSNGYGFNGTLSWKDTWTTPFTATSTVNACTTPSAIYTAQSSGNLAEIVDSVFFNIADFTDADCVGVRAAGNDNVTASVSPLLNVTRAATVIKGGLAQQQVISLDPRPRAAAVTAARTAPNDGFFCPVTYRGAFSPDNNWLLGWTAADAFGFVDFPGVAASRNGGTNPNSLTIDQPLGVGELSTFSVDLTTTGHSFGLVFGFDSPFSFVLGGGQTLLCLDLGGSGELLFQPTTPGPAANFPVVVPRGLCLYGFTFCAQAVHILGVAPFALSNALDLTVGN